MAKQTTADVGERGSFVTMCYKSGQEGITPFQTEHMKPNSTLKLGHKGIYLEPTHATKNSESHLETVTKLEYIQRTTANKRNQTVVNKFCINLRKMTHKRGPIYAASLYHLMYILVAKTH